ncbi:hypothetical protein ACPA9J_36165 [Pseudomonas aeruginosa]
MQVARAALFPADPERPAVVRRQPRRRHSRNPYYNLGANLLALIFQPRPPARRALTRSLARQEELLETYRKAITPPPLPTPNAR